MGRKTENCATGGRSVSLSKIDSHAGQLKSVKHVLWLKFIFSRCDCWPCFLHLSPPLCRPACLRSAASRLSSVDHCWLLCSIPFLWQVLLTIQLRASCRLTLKALDKPRPRTEMHASVSRRYMFRKDPLPLQLLCTPTTTVELREPNILEKGLNVPSSTECANKSYYT